MSFRFRVVKVWHHPQRGLCHAIGVIEEGAILPPVTAWIVERPGEAVQIDSQALGGTLPRGQVTLVVSEFTMDPELLEGCLLSDAWEQT